MLCRSAHNVECEITVDFECTHDSLGCIRDDETLFLRWRGGAKQKNTLGHLRENRNLNCHGGGGGLFAVLSSCVLLLTRVNTGVVWCVQMKWKKKYTQLTASCRRGTPKLSNYKSKFGGVVGVRTRTHGILYLLGLC